MKPTVHLLTCFLAICAAAPAHAVDARMKAALKRIEPATRLVQVCDLEAMERIDRDRNVFHPDRVIVDQLSAPNVRDDTLWGSGGVFRSGGDWYRFSFVCSASPDHLAVRSFEYTIGERIPHESWTRYNLFP